MPANDNNAGQQSMQSRLPLFMQQPMQEQNMKPSQSVDLQAMQQMLGQQTAPQAMHQQTSPQPMNQQLIHPSYLPQTGQIMPCGQCGTQPMSTDDIDQIQAQIPITAESIQFLNGFLRTQIGRKVRVEFLIGTNTFTDKTGILLGVGVNYILINETNTDDVVACDFYNIKFVTFYY